MRKSSAPCSISVNAAASAVSGAMMTIGTWRFSVWWRSVRQICSRVDVRSAQIDEHQVEGLGRRLLERRHAVGDRLARVAIEPQPRGHGVAKSGFVLDQQNARARFGRGAGQISSAGDASARCKPRASGSGLREDHLRPCKGTTPARTRPHRATAKESGRSAQESRVSLAGQLLVSADIDPRLETKPGPKPSPVRTPTG